VLARLLTVFFMLKPALRIVGIGNGAILIFQTAAHVIEMCLNSRLSACWVSVLQRIVDGTVLGQ
jgi:hypothetical protein